MNTAEPTAELKKWKSAKALLGEDRLLLGPYFSYQYRNTPRRILHALSYHKFAAKMIGPGKSILEIGCSEGFMTPVLAEFASAHVGLDIDEAAIAVANDTIANGRFTFMVGDVLGNVFGDFDAAASFDVIEHIFPENEDAFLKSVAANLRPDGMFVCGTPNITSDQYANAHTRAGHVNLYSAERLRESLGRHFRNVLMFSANDEMVHTGFAPMAHYLIGVGVGVTAKT